MNTIRKILQTANALSTRFFVDIGAGDEYSESQTEPLLEVGWSGVMFEIDPSKHKGLSARVARWPVKVLDTRIDPDNVLSSLEANVVPNDFLLSLDIDGYDLSVLEVILSKYQPSLVISEINEKIPPPVFFTVVPSPTYKWGNNHFYGYSLSALYPILKKYGYKIDSLDYNNVVLVRGEQTESLTDVYKRGYLDAPERKKRFFYNADFNPIYSMEPEKMVEFCNAKFSKYAGQYKIGVGEA